MRPATASKVTVSTDTINLILVLGSIAGILLLALALVDFLINRWKYFKLIVRWLHKQLLRQKPDPTPTTLNIPPAPPPTEIPVTTADGVTKRSVIYVMYGGNQLWAYEVTRKGFPGTRFLVERRLPGQPTKYKETPNREEANEQWRTWYEEWKAQPNGFAGASGTFDKLPW